jgi:HSP20 family protein
VLRSEKKPESSQDEKRCYGAERAFGRFERVIPLPEVLALDNANATFDKSLLTIRIPQSKASADDLNTRELKIGCSAPDIVSRREAR